MAIDKSASTGTEAAAIDEYFREFTAKGYPADRIVHARCTCGSDRFHLDADSDEGCARRECSRCHRAHLVCDSDEYWTDADPESTTCPCGADVFEVAVAFSHREDRSVKWITVGTRCTTCGILGAPVDWKIDYDPTDQLYDQV